MLALLVTVAVPAAVVAAADISTALSQPDDTDSGVVCTDNTDIDNETSDTIKHEDSNDSNDPAENNKYNLVTSRRVTLLLIANIAFLISAQISLEGWRFGSFSVIHHTRKALDSKSLVMDCASLSGTAQRGY